MTVLHLAVANDDILTGFSPESTIVVSSALDGYTVISGIEETVFDEHTVARLGVAAVSIRTVIVDMYASYGHVFAEQRVYNPEWRAQQGHILNEHAIALVGVDELWS